MLGLNYLCVAVLGFGSRLEGRESGPGRKVESFMRKWLFGLPWELRAIRGSASTKSGRKTAFNNPPEEQCEQPAVPVPSRLIYVNVTKIIKIFLQQWRHL